MPVAYKIRRILATTRIVTIRTLAGMAMFAVFVVFAFIALRLAIHGREVTVPNLANLSDADAATALKKLGLNLAVENRFYAAAIPVNHVLSQSPAPGAHVRRGWGIRVTESLGSQQVPVPDLTGQDQQPASFMLRRLQLELGSVAHIPGPSPTGVVLAQSPPPNVSGIDGPRVSLLVADDENVSSSAAYVMPPIVGLSLATAQSRLSTVGLHIAVSAPPEVVPDPNADPAIPPTIYSPPVVSSASIITSQSPAPATASPAPMPSTSPSITPWPRPQRRQPIPPPLPPYPATRSSTTA